MINDMGQKKKRHVKFVFYIPEKISIKKRRIFFKKKNRLFFSVKEKKSKGVKYHGEGI